MRKKAKENIKLEPFAFSNINVEICQILMYDIKNVFGEELVLWDKNTMIK